MVRRSRADRLMTMIHAERATLADDLAGLTSDQWRHRSLCADWDVEQVVAHLTAVANVGQWRWLRSIVGARFRPDVHNERRLAEFLGPTPAETLARFRAAVTSTVTPSAHTAAYLGEVVVHAADIRHPLGIRRVTDVEVLLPIAEFFVSRDFTVSSKTHAAGLELRADDAPFVAGSGPVVSGPLLSLVMSLAGRDPYLDDLTGAGVATLRGRLPAAPVAPDPD